MYTALRVASHVDYRLILDKDLVDLLIPSPHCVYTCTALQCRTFCMYPEVERVQLLDTCRKKSTFDSGYGRHAERSVHTAATRRMSTCRRSVDELYNTTDLI